MGAVIFFSIGILFLLSIPIATSRLANRMGRNPRIWFVIGLFLPLISTVILYFLPERSDTNKK